VHWLADLPGQISYSVREAAAALKIGKTTAARGFDKLRSHGFIAVVRESAFSWKVQQARRWRLTEHRCDETNTEATKDLEAIDAWRSLEPSNPSRFEAIRYLIAMGLFAADAERKQAGRKEG
jgi:DNA-binding transcriptional regulator YhcF (GntR family)